MNQLAEYQNQRILTTAHLATAYGTDEKIISQNFNRNKDRYTEGKHFYCLEGEAKQNFLNRLQIEDSSKHATTIYLWTEKGAWLHAKSLNTTKAWEAYERLVDDYYRLLTHDQQISRLKLETKKSQLENDAQFRSALTALLDSLKDRYTPEQLIELSGSITGTKTHTYKSGFYNKKVQFPPRQMLKEFRLQRGLTQEQMGAKLGVSKFIYNRVETGKRYITGELTATLAKKFGKSWDDAMKLLVS